MPFPVTKEGRKFFIRTKVRDVFFVFVSILNYSVNSPIQKVLVVRYPGDKLMARESDLSLPSSAYVRNGCHYNSSLLMPLSRDT